jgi:hypothetical protein
VATLGTDFDRVAIDIDRFARQVNARG